VKQDECTSRYSEALLPLQEHQGRTFSECVNRLQEQGYVPLGSWQDVRICNKLPVAAGEEMVLPGEHVKVARLFRYHTGCYLRACGLMAEGSFRQLFETASRPIDFLTPPYAQTGALAVTVSLHGTLRATSLTNSMNQLEVAALWKEWSVGKYRQPALGFSNIEIMDPELPQLSHKASFTSPSQSGRWLQEVVGGWRLPGPRQG
jgi:hypothetical protein